MRYFPELVYKLDSGLGIFESMFISKDGTRGVLNGPHKFFDTCGCEKDSAHVGKVSYYAAGIQESWMVENDIPLLAAKDRFVSDDVGTPISGNHFDFTPFI